MRPDQSVQTCSFESNESRKRLSVTPQMFLVEFGGELNISDMCRATVLNIDLNKCN